MSKFMVFYYAPAAAMEQMATATPEEKEAGMKPWAEWMANCGEKLVDGGSPFMPGVICGKDGNFEPANNEITGYSILEADSLDAAKEMVKSHPHLQWWDGCKVEVKECIQMG